MTPAPGWKSSEFWLHLVSVVAPAVLTALAASTNPLVAAAAAAVLAVSAQVGAVHYAANRTDLKSAAIQAAQEAALAAAKVAIPEVVPPAARPVADAMLQAVAPK